MVVITHGVSVSGCREEEGQDPYSCIPGTPGHRDTFLGSVDGTFADEWLQTAFRLVDPNGASVSC